MDMEAGDLWLPSEFLPNDFFLQGEPYSNRGNLQSEFPPVEPAPETESDEEDYLAELTRQMAHAFLKENDDDDNLSVHARDNPKQLMAGSPQSTLCDLGVWSGSGKGSPNGPSQVSSPPSTPFDQGKDDSWDLLTEAAGQVVRLRLNDHDGRGLLGRPAPVPAMAKVSLPIPSPAPLKRSGTTTGAFYSAPHITQQQLQAERFYQLKQQQLMKQQASAAWGRHLNKGKGGGGGAYGEGHCGRALGLPCSAWPPLQRQHQHHHQHQQGQPGSGMRAVFLTGSRARKESTGTGVFLPRRPGAPTSSDVRKKPACSTVLLPDRVIQALNLNLGDMVPHHLRFPGDAGGNAYLAHQKRNHYRPQPVAPTIPEQLRLPAEWTY